MLEAIYGFLSGDFFRAISIGMLVGSLINNIILFMANVLGDNLNPSNDNNVKMLRHYAVKRCMAITVMGCALLALFFLY